MNETDGPYTSVSLLSSTDLSMLEIKVNDRIHEAEDAGGRLYCAPTLVISEAHQRTSMSTAVFLYVMALTFEWPQPWSERE